MYSTKFSRLYFRMARLAVRNSFTGFDPHRFAHSFRNCYLQKAVTASDNVIFLFSHMIWITDDFI